GLNINAKPLGEKLRIQVFGIATLRTGINQGPVADWTDLTEVARTSVGDNPFMDLAARGVGFGSCALLERASRQTFRAWDFKAIVFAADHTAFVRPLPDHLVRENPFPRRHFTTRAAAHLTEDDIRLAEAHDFLHSFQPRAVVRRLRENDAL